MDKTTFRILDVLSRDLNSPISINELTKRIKKTHGTAYYKNIYDKIQDLKRKKILNLHDVGKASVITLNFNEDQLTKDLGDMESKKIQEFTKKRIGLQDGIFSEMKKEFRHVIHSIESILIINPEKNLRLNRMEFLFLLADFDKEQIIQDILSIHSIMENLQSKPNIKIDCLILTEKNFLDLLESKDSNPLKEILPDKIAFFSPQDFWITIKIALIKRIQIKTEKETNTAKITNQDLIYNLNRFGYKEMGHKIKPGKKICLEYIITSILLQDDARRIHAIPMLLMKNKVNYNLLIFLCKKYKKTGKLLGLLKVLNKIKGSEETEDAIRILKVMKVKGVKANEKSIMQTTRLYNAA